MHSFLMATESIWSNAFYGSLRYRNQFRKTVNNACLALWRLTICGVFLWSLNFVVLPAITSNYQQFRRSTSRYSWDVLSRPVRRWSTRSARSLALKSKQSCEPVKRPAKRCQPMSLETVQDRPATLATMMNILTSPPASPSASPPVSLPASPPSSWRAVGVANRRRRTIDLLIWGT